MSNGMYWDAKTPEIQQRILRILERDGRGFNELLTELGIARQTLSLYLKRLVHDGWIMRHKQGRRVLYSLVASHPEVQRMLGSVSTERLRIRGRVRLDGLDEEDYVKQWIHSLKFPLLNILNDYLALSRGIGDPERIRRLVEAHASDLTEVSIYYGELMVKRIRGGTLDPGKIVKVRDRLQKELMDYG
jgi:DNA-binding MarR family transcriptional regulator